MIPFMVIQREMPEHLRKPPFTLIIDNRSSQHRDPKTKKLKESKNWWYYFNLYMDDHPKIAEFYELRQAIGLEKAIDLEVIFNHHPQGERTIMLAELKKDDLSLDMTVLQNEIEQKYVKKMHECNCTNMHLFCSPDLTATYSFTLLKRLIGFMNDYRYIQYHIHKKPSLVIQKIDQMLRNPKPRPPTTIPIYIPYGKKGFTNSICGLVPGISMELALEIEKYYYYGMSELEIHEIICGFYDDGKHYYKKAHDIWMGFKSTWWREQ